MSGFQNASIVSTSPGEIQNPTPVSGSSVYVQDLDFTHSTFTGWTGNAALMFQSPFSASITNSTGTNPKQIVVALNRTANALQLGLGENNGGDFSNIKISLLGSGGATRAIFDESSDSTKRTSLNAEFENELFNSVLIEFYTADQVDLSNITIQRSAYVTAQIQGQDENGDFQVVRVNSDGLLLTGDFFIEASKGNIPGHSVLQKFGENPDIKASSESMWDAGGLYPWSTWDSSGPTTLDIQSDDVNDDLVGTGAQTVFIEGLDANWEEQSETIEMDGSTTVITSGSYRRLFRMVVSTAGSSGTTAGIITAEIGGIVVAQIDDGNNQSLMAIYTIPLGKTGYLLFGKASVGKAGDLAGQFFIRPFGGVFNVKHTFQIYQTTYDYLFRAVPAVPEKSDFDVRAFTTVPSGVKATAAFDLVLVDN